MKEKEPLSGSVDYGKDEDSTEALLKKQEALMSDLEAFESTIVALRDQALSCPVRYTWIEFEFPNPQIFTCSPLY